MHPATTQWKLTLLGDLAEVKSSSFYPAALTLNPWWHSDILRDKCHLCGAQGTLCHPGGTTGPCWLRRSIPTGDHSWLQAVAQGDQRISKQRAACPAQPLRGQKLSPKAGKCPPAGCDSAGCPVHCKSIQVSVPGNTLLLHPLAYGRRVISLATAQLSSWLEQGTVEIFTRPTFSSINLLKHARIQLVIFLLATWKESL